MSKSRMFGDQPGNGDGGSGPPSPRTTIVGGRPPEAGAALPPVPTGIEKLLRLASVDPEFRSILLAQRADAAAAAGVELTANEQAILGAIAVAQLSAMAEQMPPPEPRRRRFLQQAAASAVVALGGVALTACDGCRSARNIMPSEGGAAPDLPPERPEHNSLPAEGGAVPDLPDDDEAEEVLDGGASAPPRPQEPPPPQGHVPDLPPERPEEPMRTRGISPDVPPQRPQHSDTQILGGALAEDPPEK